jgi:hypothetical protein
LIEFKLQILRQKLTDKKIPVKELRGEHSVAEERRPLMGTLDNIALWALHGGRLYGLFYINQTQAAVFVGPLADSKLRRAAESTQGPATLHPICRVQNLDFSSGKRQIGNPADSGTL